MAGNNYGERSPSVQSQVSFYSLGVVDRDSDEENLSGQSSTQFGFMSQLTYHPLAAPAERSPLRSLPAADHNNKVLQLLRQQAETKHSSTALASNREKHVRTEPSKIETTTSSSAGVQKHVAPDLKYRSASEDCRQEIHVTGEGVQIHGAKKRNIDESDATITSKRQIANETLSSKSLGDAHPPASPQTDGLASVDRTSSASDLAEAIQAPSTSLGPACKFRQWRTDTGRGKYIPRFIRTPRDQAELLASEDSYQPSIIGRPMIQGQVPLLLLNRLVAVADNAARWKDPDEVANGAAENISLKETGGKDPGISSINAGNSSVPASESPMSSQGSKSIKVSWSPSPPRVHNVRGLPPDSPLGEIRNKPQLPNKSADSSPCISPAPSSVVDMSTQIALEGPLGLKADCEREIRPGSDFVDEDGSEMENDSQDSAPKALEKTSPSAKLEVSHTSGLIQVSGTPGTLKKALSDNSPTVEPRFELKALRELHEGPVMHFCNKFPVSSMSRVPGTFKNSAISSPDESGGSRSQENFTNTTRPNETLGEGNFEIESSEDEIGQFPENTTRFVKKSPGIQPISRISANTPTEFARPSPRREYKGISRLLKEVKAGPNKRGLEDAGILISENSKRPRRLSSPSERCEDDYSLKTESIRQTRRDFCTNARPKLSQTVLPSPSHSGSLKVASIPAALLNHAHGCATESVHSRQNTFVEVTFRSFRDTYQEYKGSPTQFLKACLLIRHLQKLGRATHPSLWDDFVFRHHSEYRPYLLRIAKESGSAVSFDEYYENFVKQPQYLSRVVDNVVLDKLLNVNHPNDSMVEKESPHMTYDQVADEYSAAPVSLMNQACENDISGIANIAEEDARNTPVRLWLDRATGAESLEIGTPDPFGSINYMPLLSLTEPAQTSQSRSSSHSAADVPSPEIETHNTPTDDKEHPAINLRQDEWSALPYSRATFATEAATLQKTLTRVQSSSDEKEKWWLDPEAPFKRFTRDIASLPAERRAKIATFDDNGSLKPDLRRVINIFSWRQSVSST